MGFTIKISNLSGMWFLFFSNHHAKSRIKANRSVCYVLLRLCIYIYIYIYTQGVPGFLDFYVLFAYSKGGIRLEISQNKSSNFISSLSIDTRTILHCYQVTDPYRSTNTSYNPKSHESILKPFPIINPKRCLTTLMVSYLFLGVLLKAGFLPGVWDAGAALRLLTMRPKPIRWMQPYLYLAS